MNGKTKFICSFKNIRLSWKDMRLHHCLSRKKGSNKGKRCRSLIEI